MHISEGVLSVSVLSLGALLTFLGLAVGLKKTREDQIPLVALFSSAFFVASLIHVPVGPSNAHLILNGLCGAILGWAAFPAIFVALIFQALLFQFGGITTLGINTLNMALPAIVCFYLFSFFIKAEKPIIYFAASFICGALSVLLSGILVAVSLISTGEAFIKAAKLLVIGHLPIMIIEGFITCFCVAFLKRVKPEVFEVVYENKKR